MKKISSNIKRALILTTLSCTFLGFSPASFCEIIPVCIAAEVNMRDEQRFQTYLQKAEQGDADAQYQLGNCYYAGIGTVKDDEKAVYWYTKAAKQNHSKAQNDLGVSYQDGIGVNPNDKKAAYWFAKSANQGSPVGQTNLAACYYYGQGIEQDHEKAVYWYTKAAEQNDPTAQVSSATAIITASALRQMLTRLYIGIRDRLNKDMPMHNSVWDCAAKKALVSNRTLPKPSTCTLWLPFRITAMPNTN